ncbi:BACON domain-containing protein [Porphyromonas sp.]
MKMLHKSFRVLALASLTLLVGVSACKKNDPTTDTEKTLRVLSSEHNFTAEGGAGTIVLSQEGFTAKTEATWLKIDKVEGTKVSYTVEPFAEPSTRTALVVLTRGAERQQVAVTQLGSYCYIENLQPLYKTTRQGGTIELPLYGDVKMDEVKVEALPDWVTYKLEGKKIIFTLAPSNVFERKTMAKVTLSSVYIKDVHFLQEYGSLGYDAMVGDYTLSYIEGAKNQERKTADVKLVADKDKKGLILKGLSADLPVTYDAATNEVRIILDELPKPEGVAFSLVAAAAGGGFPGADGQPNYGINWGSNFFFSATWDTTTKPDHAAFKFAPSPEAKKAGYRGIHIFLFDFDKNSYKGPYKGASGKGIYSVLDFTLTKK